MNTAYTSTTTVQDARNRYNALLAQALERIKARKTDKTVQEPEEVATTATDATPTPTQQPEPVATPEKVTTEPNEASEPEQVTATAPTKTTKTRRTKTASPKPLGRDIYHIFADKDSRWSTMLDSGVYHDPEGYALLSDNQILIGSKIDYNSARSGELIKEDGTPTNDYRINRLSCLLKPRLTEGTVYTIVPDTITKKIKEIRDEAKYKKAREIFGDTLSLSELNEELKYNSDARREATKATKYSFVELTLPRIGKVTTSRDALERFVKVSKRLALSELRIHENKMQFEGVAGFVLTCVCTVELTHRAESTIKIDLTGAMIPTEDDATPAPEDTPDTAPQQPEEDTTTAPEEVATAETPVQEPEEVTTEEATAPEVVTTAEDDATVFRKAIEEVGNLGAKYLNTLDYNQATEQVYSTKRGNSTKVTERYYTMKDGTKYGLYRRYNKNGKRAEFAVYQDGWIIEKRTYGKNNNTFKAEVKYCGGKLCYQVEEGKVTSVEYYEGKRRHYHIVFDDSNRPATPRDLPAPAPSKPTKEVPATTKQEQPTSEQAPTPEATTPPEEVQPVTTSKQEDTPYWLLLDNELRAQQQEQAPATPEKSEEEPMHAPQMLKKIIEEKKRRAAEGTNTTPLKTAVGMTTEVLTKKRAKELLGDDYSDYNTYILVDGTHVVRFDRPELSNTLYIDDESKEYKEYQRGNISAVELYRNDAIRLNDPARILDTIKHGHTSLKVIDVKGDVLVFTEYGGYHGCRIATPDEVEICKAAAREASEAFTKRLDSYIRRYGKKIYVHSYWANR